MGAYLFDGVDDYLKRTGALLAAADKPFTVGVWFRTANLTALQTLFSMSDEATNNNYFYVAANGDQVGDPVRAVEAPTFRAAASTTGFLADTWHSGTALYLSSTSRSAFIDGGSKGTAAALSSTPAGLDNTAVGALIHSTALSGMNFLAGHVAYVFVWDAELTDAEVADWHAGNIPQQAFLVAAYDLTVNHGAGPVPDLIGTADLTINGATFDAGQTPPETYTFVPPVNTIAPAVTGTPTETETLTTTNGTWDNAPTSYTYQWQRDAVNIAAATANTYTLVAADVGTDIRCVVTATNAAGSTPANSNTINDIGPNYSGAPADLGIELLMSPLTGDYTIEGGPRNMLLLGVG
jgi:hypothetical protein